MSLWRGWDGEEGEGIVIDNETKIAFAIGAGLGLLVLGWMMFARAGEENISSSGFSDGGAGVAAAPFGASSAFVRRASAASSLSLSSAALTSAAPGGLSSVRNEAVPGPASSVGAPAAPGSAASSAPAAAASGADAPPDPKEMAAAGVPTDAAGLQKLGSDSGLLTGAIASLLDHPRILHALLNNKLVVDALMNREDSKRNCGDANALQAGLSSPGAAAYESQMAPLVSAALARPDAVAAMATSEMGSRLMACPSVHALANNPAALTSIAMSNPTAVSMVSDPRVAQALSSTAQGSSLLGGVQSSMSGGAASP